MFDNYQTLFASKGNLQIPSVQTTYGKNTFNYIAIRNEGCELNAFSSVKVRSLLTEFYLNMYKKI